MCAKRTDYQIAIDDALTKFLNKHNTIHDHMVSCAARLHARLKNDDRVFFYVKGSAALARYLLRMDASPQLVDSICSRSDWDTQMVINPLLPDGEWFTAFADCEKIIVDCLDQFEEELLGVVTRTFAADRHVDHALLGGKTNDQAVRKQQNELATALRGIVAERFAHVFLETSQTSGFTTEGPKYWKLPWPNIAKLTGGKEKDILEMDIQAHNQAVLTSAKVHPGQTLANIHSVVRPDELNALQTKTLQIAEETWQRLSNATEQYDQVRAALVAKNPLIIDFLKKKLLESQSGEALLNSLPPEIVNAVLDALPKDQDTQKAATAWGSLQQARTNQQIRGDGSSAVEVAFARSLMACLARDKSVAGKLLQWCAEKLAVSPELAAYITEVHHQAVIDMLPPQDRKQLEDIENVIDADFELYHEELDPEDVAEAEKQATERFAPYTLVNQEKGSRKIGSILENMTILDFYLYRLMIRCQLSNKDPDNRLVPDAEPNVDFDSFKQQFKFRAELLDISVPRHDSLETAEQWARTRHQIAPDGDQIPLPNGEYFIDEYILMFREVLDKKSSSAHKLTKRLQRGCLIAFALAKELSEAQKWDLRLKTLATNYRVFGEVLPNQQLDLAGTALFMRMCEQLVESYDLGHNEKLRDDSAQRLRTFTKDIRRIVTAPLNDKTFLEMMRIYAHLGDQIYSHSFALANARKNQLTKDQLLALGRTIVQQVGAAFTNDPSRFKCAIVEEFAIDADPDVPDSLRQVLPLDTLKIVAYTNAAGKTSMEQIVPSLAELIRKAKPDVDVVVDSHSLYARIQQRSYLASPEEPTSGIGDLGMAVFLRIDFVIDERRDYWIAPTHDRDLKALVRQYRRSLTRYSEYSALTRRKHILRQMEKALTTYQ